MPADAAKSLLNAFVVSRLDYYNSLYTGLPRAQLDRIQSVFNGAARLIFGASRFSHVTPLLRDRLHWLRCPERICYKLCVTVFKALLVTLLISVDRRSSAKDDLRYHLRRLLASTCCAKTIILHQIRRPCFFSVAGPTAWNSLPENIRLIPTLDSFKRQLKHTCLIYPLYSLCKAPWRCKFSQCGAI